MPITRSCIAAPKHLGGVAPRLPMPPMTWGGRGCANSPGYREVREVWGGFGSFLAANWFLVGAAVPQECAVPLVAAAVWMVGGSLVTD